MRYQVLLCFFIQGTLHFTDGATGECSCGDQDLSCMIGHVFPPKVGRFPTPAVRHVISVPRDPAYIICRVDASLVGWAREAGCIGACSTADLIETCRALELRGRPGFGIRRVFL